jgi:cysteine desulfurase/selenocysteine lyase
MNEVEEYENKITSYAYKKMNSLDYVKIYGSNENRASIISFNLEGIHAHEVASFLDVEGIAVRAGHHCCQPLMNHLNVNATSRASFGIYNNFDEVDIFIEALNKCRNFFIK